MARGVARSSLGPIERSLSRERDAREFLIRNTREIVSLCGQSIVSAHAGDLALARSRARRAGALIRRYRPRASGALSRYMEVPEQEFVEASALLAIAEGSPVPTHRSLGVSGGAYVLGLLDCVGELKRMVLDRIRAGDAEGAARAFSVMEGLFGELYPFAALDKVVREARRKLDVDRMLVEDARAALTQEIRRGDLVREIRDMAAGGAAGARRG